MINKILILGSGQAALALYRVLKDIYEVIIYSREQLDLLDLGNIANKLIKADIIINAAAYNYVDKAEQQSNIANIVNHLAVEKIALFCKNNAIIFIHYSTNYVFDGVKNFYTEQDKPNPINTYGKTKYLGEKAIQTINPVHLIFRTSWLYSLIGNNFLLTMLNLAKNRSRLNIVNDQYGIPVSAYMLADITKKIISFLLNYKNKELNKFSGIYHLAANNFTTWYEYAKFIFTYLDIEINVYPIASKDYLTLAQRPKYGVLDNTKIKQVFNLYLPSWELELKSCLASYLNKNKL